jgi:hypothetical protein
LTGSPTAILQEDGCLVGWSGHNQLQLLIFNAFFLYASVYVFDEDDVFMHTN